jgi:hypothetical protein
MGCERRVVGHPSLGATAGVTQARNAARQVEFSSGVEVPAYGHDGWSIRSAAAPELEPVGQPAGCLTNAAKSSSESTGTFNFSAFSSFEPAPGPATT